MQDNLILKFGKFWKMPDYKTNLNKINEILFGTWDPIGISRNENLIDEYAQYAAQIISSKKWAVGDVERMLKIIEDDLGMPSPEERRREAAEKVALVLRKARL